TLITGPEWGEDQYGNYKNWRVLFPKSHPSQILLQATAQSPQLNREAVRSDLVQQLMQQKNFIIDDVVSLFALKLNKATVKFEWKNIKTKCQQGEDLLFAQGGEPGRNLSLLKMELADYINCNIPNFL